MLCIPYITEQNVKCKGVPLNSKNAAVVARDTSGNLEVQNSFTKYVHHRNLSCLYLVPNLFIQGKVSRTINLNTNYLVLFKNPRGKNQILLLARQMFPYKTKYFLESFNDATDAPYGYLLDDFKAKTPDNLRLKTDMLLGHPVMYKKNNQVI